MASLQDLTGLLKNSCLLQITTKKKYVKFTFKGKTSISRSNIVLKGVDYITFEHMQTMSCIENIKIKSREDFTDADYQNYPEIRQCRKLWNYSMYIEGRQGLCGIVLFKRGEINLEYIRKKYLLKDSIIISQKNNSYQYSFGLN